MEINAVTNQTLCHQSKLDHGSAKQDDLKGIKPSTHDKDSHVKMLCTVASDIYDVDCQSVVKTIESIKPSQLTAGAGAG